MKAKLIEITCKKCGDRGYVRVGGDNHNRMTCPACDMKVLVGSAVVGLGSVRFERGS